MEADAGALRDLGRVTLYFGAFILAAFAYYLGKGVSKAVGSLHIPFVGGAIEKIVNDAIVNPAKDLMDASQAGIARGLSGLLDSLAVWIGLVLVLGIGIKDAFSYLWNEALAPRIEAVVKPVRTTANRALSKANEAIDTAQRDFAAAENYAAQQGSTAIREARDFTTATVNASADAVRSEFGKAIDALQRAEDSAVTRAMNIAAAGTTAAEELTRRLVAEAEQKAAAGVSEAEQLARQAVTTAEGEIAAGVSAAEQFAQQVAASAETKAAAALAASEATFTAALDSVKSIAVTAEDDIAAINKRIDSYSLPELAATVAGIATIVTAIATEAGLDSAECRSKVGGICSTNTSQWTGLLAGLGLVTGLLSLEEIVNLARPLVGVGAAIVSEVA